jgi:hypothetical protein
MAGATIEANGGAQAGQQVAGVVAQYQLDGTNGNDERSSTSINPGGGASGITPYDSGSILGNVPPGGTGEKLVDGTIQRASRLIVDGTAGNVGNALVPSYAVGGGIPTKPTGQGKKYGLSSGATLG